MSNQDGQAVVEYMLTLLTVVAVVGTISLGFRKSLFLLWGKITQDVAAPAPGAPPNPKYRFR